MTSMFSRMRIASRLAILQAILLAFILLVGLLGLRGMAGTVDRLEQINAEVLLPSQQLGEVRTSLVAINLEVLRAFQHQPDHALVALHNHPTLMHLERADAFIKSLDENWRLYLGNHTVSAAEKALIGDFEARQSTLAPLVTKTLSALRSEDFSFENQRTFIIEAQNAIREQVTVLDKLVQIQREFAVSMHEQAEAAYNRAVWVDGALILGAVALGLIVGLMISRSITVPMGEALAVAERIAEGNLANLIDGEGGDEVSRFRAALGRMQESLRGVVGQLQTSSRHLSSSSAQLASSADSVSEASGRQSEAASSMAASVEEMTVSINHVADSAQEAARLSSDAGERSNQGARVIHTAVERMREIAMTIEQGSARVSELRDRTGEISRVVGVIRDVADQTNLLALNAAIEAARAGEQGRGFAVVADEVRKLAERTAQSTTEIGQLITAIQGAVGEVSSVMERSVASASGGVDVANEAGTAVAAITDSALAVNRVVNEISSALQEQSAAATDIAQNVERIAQMAENNAGAVGETNVAAHELRTIAVDMDGALQRFKL